MQEEKDERHRKRFEELERLENRTIRQQFEADYFALDQENIDQQESDRESKISWIQSMNLYILQHYTTSKT
jgi:hypothetical protein